MLVHPRRAELPKVRQALFHGQGVRFRVIDRETHRPIAPWTEPDNRDLNRRAVIKVFGTVARPPRPGQEPDPTAVDSDIAWFTTKELDGYQFLKEVLTSQRRWYPAGSIGNKTGLWALDADVAAYNVFRERQQEQRDRTARERQDMVSSPEPSSTVQVETAGDPQHTPDGAVQPVEEASPAAEMEPDAQKVESSIQRPLADPGHAASARPAQRRWWQFWRAWRRPF